MLRGSGDLVSRVISKVTIVTFVSVYSLYLLYPLIHLLSPMILQVGLGIQGKTRNQNLADVANTQSRGTKGLSHRCMNTEKTLHKVSIVCRSIVRNPNKATLNRCCNGCL